MLRLKQNKGITLIALIITIIVMLILVGVTVSVALNGGIFGKGEKAAFQTKASTIREQFEIKKAERVMDNNGKPLSDYSVIKIGDLEGLDDKTREEYKDKIVLDKNGNVCYNPSKVTDEEERTWLEEIGIKKLNGNTPQAFNWSDVNLKIDTSADYEFGQNATTTYVLNFTNDGKIIVKLNGEEISTIDATDSKNIDSSTGNLKFKFNVAGVGETDITFEMDSNNEDIQAYLYELDQTVIYEKKTGSNNNDDNQDDDEGTNIYNVAYTSNYTEFALYKNGMFTLKIPSYYPGTLWTGTYSFDGNKLILDAWDRQYDSTFLGADDWNTLTVEECGASILEGTYNRNDSKTNNYNPTFDSEKGIYKNSLYINAGCTNAINISQDYIHLEQIEVLNTSTVIKLQNYDKATNETISVNEDGTVITYNGEDYTLITKEQMNSAL